MSRVRRTIAVSVWYLVIPAVRENEATRDRVNSESLREIALVSSSGGH